MKLYINILNCSIPSYGLLIVVGVILANLIAIGLMRTLGHNVDEFILMEAYTFLGAFIGAKLLYLIVSYNDIDWSRILELEYFNQIMQGGFVFYGGLIGGLISVNIAGKIHNVDAISYIRSFIFLIPFIHSFGRVGCFMAGCCYGVPYHGLIAVVYPEDSLAPSGIALFPVQLIEAGLLLIIAIIVVIIQMKSERKYTVEIYFIFYGIVRFILEFYRYDNVRGSIGNLSISQWISLGMILIGIIAFYGYKEKWTRLIKRSGK